MYKEKNMKLLADIAKLCNDYLMCQLHANPQGMADVFYLLLEKMDEIHCTGEELKEYLYANHPDLTNAIVVNRCIAYLDVKPNIVIFDLDGTIANIDHRRYLVEQEPKYWDRFHQMCVNDRPNEKVIAMLNLLADQGYKIIILSGRDERVQNETRTWLAEHKIRYKHLKMRDHNDYTPDEVLKLSWLKKIGKRNVLYVFDDRDKVVNMWREQGLTCFQVAKGDF